MSWAEPSNKLKPRPGRGRALLKLDKDVPRFVDAASRSLMLHQALDHYLDLSLRVIYVLLPSRPRLNDALSELLIRHRLLLAAIADGDFERAADAIRSGLRDLQQALSGAVDSVA